METFFTNYKSDIISASIIVGVVIMLFILSNFINKWVYKKAKIHYPNADISSLKIIKKVLNLMWTVLGVIALVYVFSANSQHQMISNNFKLVFYLGVVTVGTVFLAFSLNIWFKKKVTIKKERGEDPTDLKFLSYVVSVVIYFIGILFVIMAFPQLRGVAQTALGGAGIVALVVGMASKEAIGNVVSGFFIITFDPFRIGDVIELNNGKGGKVIDITLRHTVIQNGDLKMLIVPNSEMNQQSIINADLNFRTVCQHIMVDVAYDSDLQLVKSVLQEICENHPLTLDYRSPEDIKAGKPIVRTAVNSLNDSSITVRAWVYANNSGDASSLKFDILETIVERFRKENINMPNPSSDIYLYKQN